jgi:hypothetical protein
MIPNQETENLLLHNFLGLVSSLGFNGPQKEKKNNADFTHETENDYLSISARP